LVDCLSITDERSAGYFALGMAQLHAEPVAVVCTSGTAVLNLAPCVAEAYYQNLPLVIFTADRPKEWIDQADGQTIRQNDIFRNYIKQSFELPLETTHDDDLWYFNRMLSQAIDTAKNYPSGPVHINIPLREPLYVPLPEDFDIPAIPQSAPALNLLQSDSMKAFAQKWEKAKKKMILFGILRKNETLQKLAVELAQREDTLVVAENLSNIADYNIIYAPERLVASLLDEEKTDFHPDLIITVGEGTISKRLKQYLRINKPAEHWHIGPGQYTDTYKSLSAVIQADPVTFLSELHQHPPITENKFASVKNKTLRLAELHEEFASAPGLSDLRVIHKILSVIPDNSIVHLANSTPVRYAQLSPSREFITYFANRGTSGIDGCISTAAGSAYRSQKQVFIISGDLAFIYDSNALWNNHPQLNLKIVVLNNNGGNIFSLIESSPEMDKARMYFETPHKVKIKSLTEAYGAGHLECSGLDELDSKMEELTRWNGTCVLEIKTDPKTNTRVYKEYYQFIKKGK
jgi:2-succinyl-5-enolpyruvyl-6-hydroxy-3-cyclohexene-1-carboxylate synthase